MYDLTGPPHGLHRSLQRLKIATRDRFGPSNAVNNLHSVNPQQSRTHASDTSSVSYRLTVPSDFRMALIVRPAEHADVAQCIGIRVASLGSLVIGHPPPYAGYVGESEAAMHNELDNATHVCHVKVVDPANEGEVVAYAKWEMYPHGRPNLERLSRPMDQRAKEVDQYGPLREAAQDYFCRCNGEMGKLPHIRK